MASLVKSVNYVAMNTIDKSTMGYYVIKLVSETYNLQEYNTCNRQIIPPGKIFDKVQYLSCTQDKPIGIGSRKISNK